ncbi:MAG: damage-inducible protein DinB [Treponema sp.]|jgi:uncharacterized damage-inducible protein DinB|nr:damage-inducible protein DinB [Treponema sp.]
MKTIFEIYAKYNQAGNGAVYGILDKMSNEDRERDRGSYYGSLSGLFRHVLGGTRFFLSIFEAVLGGNAAALKALEPAKGFVLPEGPLSGAQWKDLKSTMESVDAAYVNMTGALTAGDLDLPVKTEWYGGNPPAVPLSFMLSNLTMHNTHHRGQISQILDSLKIDNDYSGISAAFLPR